ncbi:efflux RND transporter permease subunit [Phaeospirillum tilakii]|uniref:Efflux RND transporter permease subunit n=1 Tax=Phaeospirillum tilakii TaxID=741673 RepID=A0ABW5CEJ8_9PROT
MLNRLIGGAVAHRLMVVIGLIALLGGGALLLPRLSLDAFPDVTNVQVTVNTEARGLAAPEVEQLITFPIEAVMYAMPDVESVRSISKTGLSVVTVVFKDGTDIHFARQQVFERLQAARDRIPAGVGTPQLGPNSSGLGQVFQYVLRSDPPGKYGPAELRGLNDWLVKLLLAPVPGVTEILSFGGEVRQFQVRLAPDRLLAHGVGIADIRAAIEANNRNEGGWFLERGAEQLVIRGIGAVSGGADGLAEIARIPVREQAGGVVRVGDVATVAFGGEIRQGAVSLTDRAADGSPRPQGEVVTGIVLKRLGANTKATIDGIKARLPAIQKALPAGVTIAPIYDQADLIEHAVGTVGRALVEAFVLIVVVLALFLMNLPATLLVLLSVPLSIGLALMAMAAWGMSANLMSLGGLAVAIGMMVDGSVVMMENIFAHLARRGAAPSGAGRDGTALVILEAAREVGRPVFFAVLIIVVVFAPLFALQGVEGRMFQPMAASIVVAMIASLGVALLVIPALATYAFRHGVTERHSPLLRPVEALYRRILPAALGRRGLVLGGAAALLVAALALVPALGMEFAPELEEGTLNVRVTLGPSANLDTALAVAAKLEADMIAFPEVTSVSSRIGRPELGGDPEPVSNIELLVGLKPVAAWTSAPNRPALQAEMERRLSLHPGLLLSFSQPIATRVDELLSGVKAQLAIKLFGPDLDLLARKGAEIETLVKTIAGTRDVALEPVEGEAQLVIRPDRDRLARRGLSVAQVMDVVGEAIGGVGAGQVIRGNERHDIAIRLDRPYRDSPEAIADLILPAANGAWVRLGDVARVEIVSGPPQIRRDDVQRRVVIQANVEGRDLGGLVAEIDRAIAGRIELPPGYAVTFGGQFENQARAQARLLVVVPLSLGLIFLLLYFAFGSLGQAGLIMLNVPLALIGGIVALFVSGQYLSVPGSIGFIALFGVAVLNGVVMVNAINQNLLGGLTLEAAVLRGALSRLRPVLMTASIAALGLIPLLLSHGIGSEVQRPLATVVVGGLVSATLLTLVVIPVAYPLFSRSLTGGADPRRAPDGN